MFLQDGKMITKEGSRRIESFQIIGTEIKLEIASSRMDTMVLVIGTEINL